MTNYYECVSGSKVKAPWILILRNG